jgi:hypothetical protein
MPLSISGHERSDDVLGDDRERQHFHGCPQHQRGHLGGAGQPERYGARLYGRRHAGAALEPQLDDVEGLKKRRRREHQRERQGGTVSRPRHGHCSEPQDEREPRTGKP